MQRLSKKVWYVLGFAVSLGLLIMAFWEVNFTELADIVMATDLRILVVVVFLNYSVIGIKGLRWKEIIGTTHRVAWVEVTLASFIGYMASCILPARGGEVVRVLVLGRRTGMSRTMLAGALAVDHIVEGAGMVLIMLSLPFLLSTPVWMRTATSVVGGVTIAAAIIGWLFIGAHHVDAVKWLPASWRPRVTATAAKLSEGLATLRNVPRLVYVMAIALVLWAVQAALLALCLYATGLSLSFAQVIFVLMAINVAALIPGAPASVGPFEFAAVLSLGSLGISKTPALTAALLYHAVQVFPTIVAGLAALPLAGMRFRDLSLAKPTQS